MHRIPALSARPCCVISPAKQQPSLRKRSSFFHKTGGYSKIGDKGWSSPGWASVTSSSMPLLRQVSLQGVSEGQAEGETQSQEKPWYRAVIFLVAGAVVGAALAYAFTTYGGGKESNVISVLTLCAVVGVPTFSGVVWVLLDINTLKGGLKALDAKVVEGFRSVRDDIANLK